MAQFKVTVKRFDTERKYKEDGTPYYDILEKKELEVPAEDKFNAVEVVEWWIYQEHPEYWFGFFITQKSPEYRLMNNQDVVYYEKMTGITDREKLVEELYDFVYKRTHVPIG